MFLSIQFVRTWDSLLHNFCGAVVSLAIDSGLVAVMKLVLRAAEDTLVLVPLSKEAHPGSTRMVLPPCA